MRVAAVRLVGWLVVNELELTALTGTEDIPHSLQLFMERYPQQKS